ncbi:MAG: lipopolysaccharide biosynthesis protein [Fimbriimonadaceae bacterium]
MKTRSSRIKANFLAASTGNAVRLLDKIALVPFFLTIWGPEYYGYWLMLTAVPSMLSVSNLGMGTAALVRIVHTLGEGDEAEANSICLSSILTILAIFGVLIVGLLLFPLEWFVDPESIAIAYPNIILAVMMGEVALGLASQPFAGFWTYREKAHVSMLFQTANALLMLGVTIAVLLVGGLALNLVFATGAASVVWFLVYVGFSLKQVVHRAPARPSFRLVKLLLGKGAGFQLAALWQSLLFQGTVLLAGFLFGPAGASAWGTVRALARAGNQALDLIGRSIMPELQKSVAKRDLVVSRKLHSFTVSISVFIGLIGAVIITVGGPFIYPIWTTGELDVSYGAWPLLALGLLFSTTWATSQNVHRAMNEPWAVNLSGVLMAAISLGLSWLFAQFMSPMVAMAAGALFFDLAMATFVLKRSLYFLQDSFGDFVARSKETPALIKANLKRRKEPSPETQP